MTYAEFQQQLQELPPEERLLALLAWLNRKESLLALEAYTDEAQGGAPNPLDHPRLQA